MTARVMIHSLCNIDYLSVLSAKHITTASDKKVEPIEVSTANSPYSVTGNIIIDMEILSSILNLLACPSCSKCSQHEII